MQSALLYVSRQSLGGGDNDEAIRNIVAQARWLNAQSDITGALVCTRDSFTQLIEGPSENVDQLMRRIAKDGRHTQVTVLRVTSIAERYLPDWSMAYSGTPSYVARHVEPLIATGARASPADIDALLELLVAFASD